MRKHAFITVLCFLTFYAAACSSGSASPGTSYFEQLEEENGYLIDAEELADRIKSKPDELKIIDIRQHEDYLEGFIPGAEHCWWYDMRDEIGTLPREKTIVVYCYTGQSSGQIVGVLRTAGFKALSLKGGWLNGWKPYKDAVAGGT